MKESKKELEALAKDYIQKEYKTYLVEQKWTNNILKEPPC